MTDHILEFYSPFCVIDKNIDKCKICFKKCWRWSGFNFGVDLLLNYNDGVITLKRNCLSQWTPYSTNLKFDVLLHYRMIIGNKHGKFLYDSTIRTRSLRIDQTVIIARFLPAAEEFPVAVHFFYLATLPSKPVLSYWEPYLKKSESPT
ncbi:unnamed protein product [Onchocerca flexuosa]|uniref:Uncharacterized protein n=1 Tax=Onchocerca flexuosa TaxID=387005 RepID=A0A3P7WLH6_9BILA|nr:unnamed protein product [Onchocerca flexuosa]